MRVLDVGLDEAPDEGMRFERKTHNATDASKALNGGREMGAEKERERTGKGWREINNKKLPTYNIHDGYQYLYT